MPLYEFTCINCDRTLTISASYDELDGLTCPDCKEILKRSYTFGAVSFKGSGFYATDKGKQ
jgi:putative FmdB family regulatory protein